MAFLVKFLNFIFQPFLFLLCFYLLKSQSEIQYNEMHAQISNLKLQLDSNNISYNKCTCQMENATEGAVKEVTWWSWIWQSLVNVFWVVMALNNLFVGFIFFFRGPSGL
ncbi:uncharacterized protein LOC111118344 isoform X1 [Crassostrea virginica]